MTAFALSQDERRQWSIAAAAALAAHLVVAALVLAWARVPAPPTVEPVMILELPAEGGAVAAPTPLSNEKQPQPPQPQVATTRPLVQAPPVNAPLPREVVDVPPPAPVQPSTAQIAAVPAPAAPAPASAPARAVVGPGTSSSPGDSAKAKQQEVDYFAQVSAYLNRRKNYPVEARKAQQQGVVVIRFTVDRMGNVSAVSIKRGSGHDLLDNATLDLLRRVAPLPKMPGSMQRDSVTLSLPIDYSLRTN